MRSNYITWFEGTVFTHNNWCCPLFSVMFSFNNSGVWVSLHALTNLEDQTPRPLVQNPVLESGQSLVWTSPKEIDSILEGFRIWNLRRIRTPKSRAWATNLTHRDFLEFRVNNYCWYNDRTTGIPSCLHKHWYRSCGPIARFREKFSDTFRPVLLTVFLVVKIVPKSSN